MKKIKAIPDTSKIGNILKLLFIVYLVVYSLIVISIVNDIIKGTLHDGYFDLQVAFAWMLPTLLCFPSSLLAMSLFQPILSTIFITVAVKLLGMPLDNNDITKGVASTISMGISFLLAGFLQYYLIIVLPRHLKKFIDKYKQIKINDIIKYVLIYISMISAIIIIFYSATFFIALQNI